MGLEENVVAPIIAAGGAICDRVCAPVNADAGAEDETARAGHSNALNWRAAIGGEAGCLGAAAQSAGAVGGDDGVSEHSGEVVAI